MTNDALNGACQVCGAQASKASMLEHLGHCLSARAGEGTNASQAAVLRAEPPYAPFYWVDLAVRPGATLAQLDALLRRVWLECCGHLSGFYAGRHEDVSMKARVEEVLRRKGSRLNYIYDFGSSTELRIVRLGTAESRLRSPVQVVARNEPPVWACVVCGQAALRVCAGCGSDDAFYCTDHAKAHDCGAEMLLPVVNSPRMGVCGYTGKA